MWMNSEEARSDFVLAAAAALLGSLAVSLLEVLPFYPGVGTLLGSLLYLVWIFVLTALVPILLVRYRDQDIRGYGLEGERSAWLPGLLVALPVILVGYLRGLPNRGVVRAALGRFDRSLVGSPVVGEDAGAFAGVDVILNILFVAVLAVSGLVFYGFLVTRARDGFKQTDLPIVEGLRTFGIGAAGAGLLLGLLVVLAGSTRFVAVALNVGGLVVAVLLADRLVAQNATTTRATLLAPAVVALIAQVLAFGGLFRGDILLGLFHGVLSAGLVIVFAALVETRRYAWGAVPIAIAAAIYPTCLSLPVAFNATLMPFC